MWRTTKSFKILAVVALLFGAVPAVFADGGSMPNSWPNAIDYNSTNRRGMATGVERIGPFYQEDFAYDSTSLFYSTEVGKKWVYAKTSRQSFAGDIMTYDTSIRTTTDTPGLYLRPMGPSMDSFPVQASISTFVRPVVAFGTNVCDTNAFCYFTTQGPETNVLGGGTWVRGDVLTLGFVSSVGQANLVRVSDLLGLVTDTNTYLAKLQKFAVASDSNVAGNRALIDVGRILGE